MRYIVPRAVVRKTTGEVLMYEDKIVLCRNSKELKELLTFAFMEGFYAINTKRRFFSFKDKTIEYSQLPGLTHIYSNCDLEVDGVEDYLT